MTKIDIFSHISTLAYKDAISKLSSANPVLKQHAEAFASTLSDLDSRFRMMDKFKGYVQVLTLAEPPVEQLADSEEAVELARVANDSMAELVAKYPDRFVAAVATLPMNNIDASLKEIDRAVNDLGLKGVLVYSNINDKPLDSPEFLPLYEKMSQYNLPIWIHPTGGDDHADYRTEEKSIYMIRSLYGWPNETSVAMTRLACSGIMEKYPTLKVITHHCGGVVPFNAGRITEFGDVLLRETGKYMPLTRKPIEYLKMFYGDTAIYGQVPALMCGYHFFGPDHMLFGTDMPLGSFSEPGIAGLKLAIDGIDKMEIDNSARKKIYEDNARRLLRLS